MNGFVSSLTAGFNLGNWGTFNTSKSVKSSQAAMSVGMSSSMLTGTFSCAVPQTDPSCVATQDYLPGLQTAILQGQLQPSLFCYTLMLSGIDVTAQFQETYCNNPGALPNGIIAEPIVANSGSISGSQSVAANAIINYSYPFVDGNYYAWNVVNGSIISGQGTSAITVQWSNQCGIVQLVEFVDGICPAPTVCLDVQIIGANCVYPGCTLAGACNYDPLANSNDGSCLFPDSPCDDLNPNTVADAYNNNCECIGVNNVVSGCTDPGACNFNPLANSDNGSCTFPGCIDVTACNFNSSAGCSDGSCLYLSPGTILGNNNPLVGNSEVYSTTLIDGLDYVWAVSGSGNIVASNNNVITVQWNGTGNYFVELTVINGPCSEVTTFNVNVDCNFPSVSILGDNSVQNGSIVTFSTGIIDGATYDWQLTSNPVGEANIISGIGTNAVQVQFGNNFLGGSYSFQLVVTDIFEINDDSNGWMLYPNPATNVIRILGMGSTVGLEYRITDVSGRIIKASKLLNDQIEIEELVSSSYILEIVANNNVTIRKRFIKK
jgi:hypothetical protein